MNSEELFYHIFENIPRQGPGTKASTLKAFSAIKKLSADAHILDIGCGKGVQTFDLAEVTNGTIIAVDNHPFFIDFLNLHAKQLNLQNRVKAMVADMNDLPFAEKQFDLIWAEGSIFITGFENGLKNWAKFLKDDGYMVVSEAAWFSNDPPEEIKEFWNNVYPDLLTIPQQEKIIAKCGYQLVESFNLPKEGWLIDYYSFMEKPMQDCSSYFQYLCFVLFVFKKFLSSHFLFIL